MTRFGRTLPYDDTHRGSACCTLSFGCPATDDTSFLLFSLGDNVRTSAKTKRCPVWAAEKKIPPSFGNTSRERWPGSGMVGVKVRVRVRFSDKFDAQLQYGIRESSNPATALSELFESVEPCVLHTAANAISEDRVHGDCMQDVHHHLLFP